MVYQFDLDDNFSALWPELERVQDGDRCHVITMNSLSAHDASVELLHRLIPFFAERFEEVPNA